MKRFLLLTFLTALLFSCSHSDQKQKFEPPTKEDYKRAEHFRWDSLAERVNKLSIQPQWFQDSTGFAYEVNTNDGKEFYKVSFLNQKKEEAFDNHRLADTLQNRTGKHIAPDSLPIQYMEWSTNTEVTLHLEEKKFTVDLNNYTAEPEEYDTPLRDTILSPDGRYKLYSADNDLYIKDTQADVSFALSEDGSDSYMYGSAYGWGQTMKGEGTAPSHRLNASWSPNSKKILTQISDTRDAEKMYLLDWSIDSLYRPELLSYYRPSPGDTTFVKLIPVIYDLEAKEMTKIDLDPQPHMLDLGENLYWSEQGDHIYGTYDPRGFKEKEFIEVHPETGNVKTIFTDKSETNIEYNTLFHYVEEEHIAFITSEQSGWKQLYRLDWNSGELKPVTKGDFVVKNIEAIDTEHKQLYFTAAGKEDGVNPYYDLLYKVDFDGSNLELLTPEPVNHEVFIEPGMAYFVDNQSTAEDPTVTTLRNTKDGEMLMEVDSADIKRLKDMNWAPPQLFTATAQDGETEIHGALWKPTDFDESKKYPIVDYTYTGPHMNVFPNTFNSGLYSLYNSAQALAELGFIVLQVDGMGTAGRSKEFHNKSYKNMGNNLKDHTLAIKQLGEQYTWVDTTRVGIFGHSAGGYDAGHALLAFNDTYDVAIAESADHDWRMEKAWWPELYAGWPVDSVYHEQSNITMAPKLKGKLLLIHGGIDENVNPSATFKFGEALIKADKYFDQLIVPSARHGFPDDYMPYIMKKRWDFFVEHLITNPPQ